MANELTEKPYGSTRVSVAEEREHEVPLMAKRIVEVPSDMQARWVYDGSNNCIYAAYAARGLAESAQGWLLHKYTWVGTNCTKREIAYDSYQNYLIASYA
jgi:hypothetical protein